MLNKFCFILAACLLAGWNSSAQDTAKYKLMFDLPVVDFPQNTTLPYMYPSMDQSLKIANDFYELGFWGIDELGNKIFIPKTKINSGTRKAANHIFKYALGLAFSKYGSELPIPLGVWMHEEFHRSTLGIENIHAKNGNWIFSRWDGTVYGVSDAQLSTLKTADLNQLLYSYVSGVQSEVLLNEYTTLNGFYHDRSLYKNALLLYNAYYVYNYFSFSTSPFSDSVKVLAPPHENANPSERDYAGADLTAWAYDMFLPNLPYTSRDSFPDGDGVNRRVGFSELPTDAQEFLNKQQNLSLLNFLNPAIFFVNKIRVTDNFAFNFFTQYSPTHFGNDIALYLPVKYKDFDLLLNIHNYNNSTDNGYGIGLGLFNYAISDKIKADVTLNAWSQPQGFYNNSKLTGGSAKLKAGYMIRNNLSAYAAVVGKTKGWMLGNPYLEENITVQLGLGYTLIKE